YRIDITNESIELLANNESGAYYALGTLRQIIENSNKELNCMRISDWPDFKRRGVMLDISRDKVPTMESIKLMLDRFASWKVNEVQLYIEHTFAYKNHQQVWKDASPLTAEEILELDAYCRERYIDLVPNQNSLGHMERWLKHEDYFHLAERPVHIESDNWIIDGRRMTLCAVNPDAVEFMDDLYGEYLPNFSSKFVNIGGDEPYELGYGLSADACEKHGKSTVYLNYMKKIVKRSNQYGKKAQMWGDIVTKHPELIPLMPKDIICMVWGYRPEHPFEEQCARFQEEGIPFYVCPGTSGWRTYIGKTQRAILNINNAIENGKKYGAIGVLNTDWGDRGHMQPITSAYPALLYGAGMSWASDTNMEVDLAQLLNTRVFMDETGEFGQALMQLTNAYMGGKGVDQAGRPYFDMMDRIEFFFEKDYQLKHYDLELLPGMRREIKQALKKVEKAQPTSIDAQIAIQELRTAARLADWGCRFIEARIAAPEQDIYKVSARLRKQLANELEAISEEHRQTWLLRNRPGGLSDSVARMKKVKQLLLKGM
ncbi:MAG: family 20 glycosylhydrolase, partial [Carboxylicivirga sp.]|nr:family 20 glycosylhydrolase [Carboxylicivirga sp.]